MASINSATAQTTTKSVKVNNAAIPEVRSLLAAGINPKTGLPLKVDTKYGARKENIKKTLRIIDEQDAINRYRWYNLPCSLTSQELERLLYYKGQLAFFYLEGTEEFYFMPYALDGGLDFYGRYRRIHPVPMAESSDSDKARNAEIARQRQALAEIKLDVVYDVLTEPTAQDITKKCVLLHDYSKQMAETLIPRQQLQEGILDIMSDCIPFMRTALLNSTGINGMRVTSQDEQSNVEAANMLIDQAALDGRKFIAMVGGIDFQELTGGEVAKSEEFLLAMQALDNFRLSTYGIDNGGLFEKKAHTLQSEQDMNTGATGFVYNDGLKIRQHFCDVVNSIFDLGIWCDVSECAIGQDRDGDGAIVDEEDQSGQANGEQPQEVVSNAE